MIQEAYKIKRLINEGISIINRMNNITTSSVAGQNTLKLRTVIKEIYPLIQNDYPIISDILLGAYLKLIQNGLINAFFFGDIRTSLKILKGEYEKTKKIFISHSSKDIELIEEFVDHILQLGINIVPKDISCTSIEDMNIENGKDIRKYINDNILSSDFSLLMISDNYKNSEICLNEMGAVWINKNNVRYYLLPQTSFDNIGWLCNVNEAEYISNRIALDKMHEELINYYDMEDNIDSWSRQRETFIKHIENLY